jgi:hypothetical protein
MVQNNVHCTKPVPHSSAPRREEHHLSLAVAWNRVLLTWPLWIITFPVQSSIDHEIKPHRRSIVELKSKGGELGTWPTVHPHIISLNKKIAEVGLSHEPCPYVRITWLSTVVMISPTPGQTTRIPSLCLHSCEHVGGGKQARKSLLKSAVLEITLLQRRLQKNVPLYSPVFTFDILIFIIYIGKKVKRRTTL